MGSKLYSSFGPIKSFVIVYLVSAFGALLLLIYTENIILIPVLVSIIKMGVSAGLTNSYIANV